MNAAILKTPIEIHALTTTKTEYGTIQTSYALKYSTKSHVKFGSEQQVVSEGEVLFPVVLTFIVRAYVPVIETDRIKYDDKWWKIVSINKNIYYNDIEIVCQLVND